MVKRILDCTASDFRTMNSRELKESIYAAEGRTILAETVSTSPPLISGVSNAEICVALGADIIVLNGYDVKKPIIIGIPKNTEAKENILDVEIEGEGATIEDLKRLIVHPVGIKLEPIDPNASIAGELTSISSGRIFSIENMKLAVKQGSDFIRIMGNPGSGCTYKTMIKAIKLAKKTVGKKVLIASGKGHGMGVKNDMGMNCTSPKRVKELIKAGVDWIVLPAPGTTPGATVEFVRELVELAHDHNLLASSEMLTSQEGSDVDTIRRIGLFSKMTGADIHHIGDSGYEGIAVPENILALSIVIRGRRHTYRRMALSPFR